MRDSALLLSLFLAAGLCVPAHAAPPYLAVEVATDLGFARHGCTSLAESALRADGFAKIETYPGGGSVFAAYREGADYGYKTLVKCLPEQALAMVVVTADSRKTIRAKAGQIAARLRQLASAGHTPALGEAQAAAAPPPRASSSPQLDCGDGPTLKRCLNTLPDSSVGDVLRHLHELEAPR